MAGGVHRDRSGKVQHFLGKAAPLVEKPAPTPALVPQEARMLARNHKTAFRSFYKGLLRSFGGDPCHVLRLRIVGGPGVLRLLASGPLVGAKAPLDNPALFCLTYVKASGLPPPQFSCRVTIPYVPVWPGTRPRPSKATQPPVGPCLPPFERLDQGEEPQASRAFDRVKESFS
jgi:hypothetical protein